MEKASDFEVMTAEGKTFRLSEHLPLVLYFYPKDSTSGCTTEAKEFTERVSEFTKLGYEVAGVSRDSVKSHQNFICRYGLGVELLSDPEETVCRAFDVIKEKNMYGRKVMGVVRSTFVIDKDMNITHSWTKVKAAGHAAAVLEALKSE